ncbi:InlB B-repeat-containing protein [Bifidobacterium asteroides]|uniref:RCC1 domain-containing protein n=1 Tax=Bifidobacterium asteroides TaxID=1684 RepID=UPI0018A222CE|nr:InlB B-repeat-containing protein [Bifidobacterium asteroides]
MSLLLAIILIAGLIMGSLATADTDTNTNIDTDTSQPTLQTTPTTPQSPLTPTPSPLNTTPEHDQTPDSRPQARSTRHTVTFDSADGSSIDPQNVDDGAQASRPAKDPTRDGYLFDGWFTGNLAYDFTQPVTADLTLTAHWTKGTSAWSLSPTSGPAAGGDKITLVPPAKPGIRFSHISPGLWHTLATGSDGNLYSWGDNKAGLGRSTTIMPADGPGLVTPPAGVHFTQTSAGMTLSLAIGSDGNLYSWGQNDNGQLGRSTTITPADRPGLVTPPAGVHFTQVSAGYSQSLAIGSDGNLYSWGDNSLGQLGRDTGSATYDATPGRVSMPTGITCTKISGGTFYSLALGSDGNIYSWGNNTQGELGRNTNSEQPGTLPNKVILPKGVTKYTAIAAQGWCSLAMGSDGNLYSWGYNSNGQMGRETDTPTQNIDPGKVTLPTGVTRFTQFSTGNQHTLAVGSDGNLYSWGSNKFGQLGRDASSLRNVTPGKVSLPAGISCTQINAGNTSSLAVGSDGNLYSWGDNSRGQLGRRTNGSSDAHPGTVTFPEDPRPVSVSFGGTPGTNLIAESNGTWSVTTPQHAAGKADVTIIWSMNGQQPDNHLTYQYMNAYNLVFSSDSDSPPAPSGMPGPQSVTEGRQATRPTADPTRDGFLFDGWFLKDANGNSNVAYDFSQPVTSNITLVAHWSPVDIGSWAISPNNGDAQGGQQVTITPPKTSRGIRFNQISASDNFTGFSVGVASDGNAYAWGDNEYGQLGQDPSTTATQNAPTKVPMPDGVPIGFTYTQVAVGGSHVLAIGSDQTIYSWGQNQYGQLGDGSTQDRSKPQPVKGPDGQPFKATQVTAGFTDSAAIDLNGRVYVWGSETNGQNTYSASKLTPTLAKDPNGSDKGLKAVQVSARYGFLMALDTNGNVYTWGYNNHGQLGNGQSTGKYSTAYVADPAPVPDPKNASKTFKARMISSGEVHALAIGQDGTAWAWGMNADGQIGDGTLTDRSTPTQVKNPADPSQGFKAAQIIAGATSSLAVDQSGTAWGWGENTFDQLGSNQGTSELLVPSQVSPPAGQGNAGEGFAVARISAGSACSLAIGQDGKSYSWGYNYRGQLGTGSNSATKIITPTLVALYPPPLITGVRFDQTAANSLRQNADGSVTLATPAHNPGPSDVIVDWSLGTANQTPTHLSYTFKGILPLTGETGVLLLLASGLLAAAGALAARRHRHEFTSLE